MRIALIGPGIDTIPPRGHGAVEIVIWDLYNEMVQQGHYVKIVNKMRNNETEQRDASSAYCQELIEEINSGNYDVVHIHYDVLYGIMDHLTAKTIAMTSHYPYIEQIHRHESDIYSNIFKFLVCNKKYLNITISRKDYDAFIRYGSDPKFVKIWNNGVNVNLFEFDSAPILDKTLCLGKISRRKGQYLFQDIESIDFAGPVEDPNFNSNRKNYKGHWSREEVYKNMTKYTNLLLWSDGEADPLVVKEAFAAGLGVVISPLSAENLDTSLPFISIPPQGSNIIQVLEENKNISRTLRNEIRKYAEDTFDISIKTSQLLKIYGE
jgi:hypothetical protein